MQKDGILYVVATPIGNLHDFSQRAVTLLQQVDRIAAEDTRHSASLLKHYSITKPMLSLHNFNERDRVEQILSYLAQGESVALISDAGTPLISDPGYHLVKAVRAAGYRVVPVPGACALVAALSASGLATDRFVFEGFLPAKAPARHHDLTELANEPRTMVFYEAPHRLLATLESMVSVFGGDREVVVARELTKVYESILQKSLTDMLAYYASHETECRGEIVILVAGAPIKTEDNASDTERVLGILLAELPLKQAAAITAKLTGGRKNEIYEKALQMAKE